jgi:molybdopterin-biosynthesis enzyme MoeA-like protein
MNQPKNFYSIIIGTELLNGRRTDGHFAFLNQQLTSRGLIHKASFVIDDDPIFMQQIFEQIKSDPNSVMFSFGGIGATPDDYTREVAAKAFRDGAMEIHESAKAKIIEKFGDEAYPHRINMANLPINAKLLHNPVTNVPGFYLDERFFFVPGFPSMAHPMIIEALDRYYPSGQQKYRLTLRAHSSENDFIPFYEMLPSDIELSSLPHIDGDKRRVDISLASYNQDKVSFWYNSLTNFLEEKKIPYTKEA